MRQLQRIMVIGASGAGKSTLAAALGARFGLPVIHGDAFFFHPGWVQRDSEDSRRLFLDAAAGPRWIIDGNNSATLDARAERADLIILLELNRWRRLARTLLRSLRWYGRTRPDMAEGCPERFDPAFQFGWVLGYHRHTGPAIDAFLGRWEGRRPILRLSSTRAVRRLLADPDAVLASVAGADGRC